MSPVTFKKEKKEREKNIYKKKKKRKKYKGVELVDGGSVIDEATSSSFQQCVDTLAEPFVLCFFITVAPLLVLPA